MVNYSALDIEQVLYIHERIISFAGGKQGVRDFALLHSALERCKATFGGDDLYPSLFHKAAALLHSMIMNHPFLDGNKRTAYAIMSRFLNSNSHYVSSTQDEIVTMCVAVDNEGWNIKDIVSWLEKHVEEKIR